MVAAVVVMFIALIVLLSILLYVKDSTSIGGCCRGDDGAHGGETRY